MRPEVTHGELARRVASAGRDPAAEAELCRRFAPRIRLYGLKHLRDEERARDLVQAVLVVLIEAVRAGRVDEPDLLDRFVLGTCRNLAARARHADSRTEALDLDPPDQASVMPATDALDIAAMARCFEQLELRARMVLQLAFFRDKSADEIAAVLETTAGNVRVIRHRAVVQLRDCVERGAA